MLKEDSMKIWKWFKQNAFLSKSTNSVALAPSRHKKDVHKKMIIFISVFTTKKKLQSSSNNCKISTTTTTPEAKWYSSQKKKNETFFLWMPNANVSKNGWMVVGQALIIGICTCYLIIIITGSEEETKIIFIFYLFVSRLCVKEFM